MTVSRKQSIHYICRKVHKTNLYRRRICFKQLYMFYWYALILLLFLETF